jgi:hypothetical protein
MHRYITATLAAAYWTAMFALLGGIGVLAAGAPAPAVKHGSGIGFALLMILQG